MENTPLDGTAVGPKETLQAWERTYIAQQYRIGVARTTIGDTLRSLRGSFGTQLWDELNAICDAIDAGEGPAAPSTTEPTATDSTPLGWMLFFVGLMVGFLTVAFAWYFTQGTLTFVPPSLGLLLAGYLITRKGRRALGVGLLVGIFAAPFSVFLLFAMVCSGGPC